LELLAISGPSGRERQVLKFIADRLRGAGAPRGAIRLDQAQRRSPFGGEVGNLALRLPGTRPAARRVLMAHADTVPLCAGARPVRRGDWLVPADRHTGLGADDRAGTAVVLAAALEVLSKGLDHPPLTFLWTVQEELGMVGARYLRLGLLGRPRLAFNFDGGSYEKITIGATGGYRLTIGVSGIASHAGIAPEQGVSAITIAALAITKLYRGGWLGKIKKPGGTGTSNIGVIHGGEVTNVVTPQLELRAEVRSHDPVFRETIVRAIQGTFRRAARLVRNDRRRHGAVRFNGRLDYEAFCLPADDPSVRAAEEAIRALGGRPVCAVSNGGLDANWLTARGVPTVTLGCGQASPHTVSERLCRSEFHKASRLALRLATDM
jgi:tripeptide aminopeptidase